MCNAENRKPNIKSQIYLCIKDSLEKERKNRGRETATYLIYEASRVSAGYKADLTQFYRTLAS